MAPGPELAALLAAVDRDRLSGHDRVALLQAEARMVSHYQARMCASTASIHTYHSSDPRNADLFVTSEIDDLVSTEIAAALSWTRRAAESHLGLALTLDRELIEVRDALESGAIDLARTRVICEETSHLPPATVGEVAAGILGVAPGLTTGQIGARLRRMCIDVDPDSARARYRRQVRERRLEGHLDPEGTANIYALHLPPELAAAAMDRIDRLAKTAKSRHDDRSIDEIRADVFLDLLTGRSQHRTGGGTVADIRVDLSTLAGLDESPGEIPGWGPVIADIARKAAENATRIQATITADGELVDVVTTQRRPTADQRRQVQATNPTCIFPGCRLPASRSDLDHNPPWAASHQTRARDLAPLCRYHHTQRHRGRWALVRSEDGYRWTSPLGHTYTTGADPP